MVMTGCGGSLDASERIQERHDIPKMIWDFMATISFRTLSPGRICEAMASCRQNPERLAFAISRKAAVSTSRSRTLARRIK